MIQSLRNVVIEATETLLEFGEAAAEEVRERVLGTHQQGTTVALCR